MLRGVKKPTEAKGKLGILMPGMGAVATTFVAGVEAVRKGLGKPVGSLTQMAHWPEDAHSSSHNHHQAAHSGKQGKPSQLLKDVLPLARLNDLEFGGWDIHDTNLFQVASEAKVLESDLLRQIRPFLESIKPMPAVFRREYVRKLEGSHVKQGTWWEMAQQLKEDIAQFAKTKHVDRMVMVWCGSTETYQEEGAAHHNLRNFEAALKSDDPSITPSMVYAYAALSSGVPYANGAPNLTTDIPALHELAREMGTPLCGKDFKTGQTLMKTVVAPGLQARMLGVNGWFSTNILGNRDGQVLDDPSSFKTKEMSKLSVLESILDNKKYPDLYGDMSHKVRIEYYPPRGDNKEGWDNIDIFGWLGYSMQIKINFLCRDSILAAPIVLDLALLMDLAKRSHLSGVQDWLSFYFKAPMQHHQGDVPEHDLFVQRDQLYAALKAIHNAG